MSELNQKPLVEEVREIRRASRSENTAEILGERRHLSAAMDEKTARAEENKYTRRGIIVGGVTAVLGIMGWGWMGDETKATLLRSTFQLNERLSQIFYSPRRLSPEFPREQITVPPRVNGFEGMQGEIDPAAWRLAVGGLAGRTDDLILKLDDIKRLPRVEMTTELKCIEGWSVIVNWAGARFSDFAAAYLPMTVDGSSPDVAAHPERLVPYVSITTPDDGYYVGWDMPSILHPQTLLAYEMNGEPLKPEHGAPLRIASPTKYGIKQIKRIGRIEFTAERPRDFWAESGYDWYSGH